MTSRQTNAALANVRRALLAPDGAGLTDAQLLELFLGHCDSAAFEALVRRHGSMVLGVCRRVTRHGQDAEDAFQATFLVLARKAASVRPRERVANWLYGVAYRVSLKARAASSRRAARERSLDAGVDPPTRPEPVADGLHEVLDRELNQLPTLYRLPLILCDIEGRPRKEVAGQLGIPEGTLSSRLTSARRRLAARLGRRGVVATIGTLAAARTGLPGLAADVPGELLERTVRGGLTRSSRQAPAGAISPQAVALSDRMVHGLATARLRVAGAITVALLLAGAVVMGPVTNRTDKAAPEAAPTEPPRSGPDDAPTRQPRAAKSGLRASIERLEWTLSAVDAERQSLSVTDPAAQGDAKMLVVTNGGGGLALSGLSFRQLPVEPGAVIELDGKKARLADLGAGMRVKLQLADGRLAVDRVLARTPKSPTLACKVIEVDRTRQTLAVAVGETDIRLDGLRITPDTRIEVYRLAPDQAVTYRRATLADLEPGTSVSLELESDSNGSVVVRQIRFAE